MEGIVNITQYGRLREVVRTTILQQDPPNHKIDGGLCLHAPSLTSDGGVFIAYSPLYPTVKMTMRCKPHFSCLSSNADSC